MMVGETMFGSRASGRGWQARLRVVVRPGPEPGERWDCSALVVLGVAWPLAASPPASAAAPPVTVTFDSPGQHAFTVPDKVTRLQINARGAGGGSGLAPGDVFAKPAPGGSGAQITRPGGEIRPWG